MPSGQKVLPRRLVEHAYAKSRAATVSRRMLIAGWVVTAAVAFLSINPLANMLSARQIMNTSFDPLNLVNTYGAFGSIGRERLAVIFEGTDADTPFNQDTSWKPYPYIALPVDYKQDASSSRTLPTASRLADVVRFNVNTAKLPMDSQPGFETASQRCRRAQLVCE